MRICLDCFYMKIKPLSNGVARCINSNAPKEILNLFPTENVIIDDNISPVVLDQLAFRAKMCPYFQSMNDRRETDGTKER